MNEWHIYGITVHVIFFSLIKAEVWKLFYQVAWKLCKQPKKKWAILYFMSKYETTEHHMWTISTQKILCSLQDLTCGKFFTFPIMCLLRKIHKYIIQSHLAFAYVTPVFLSLSHFFLQSLEVINLHGSIK